MKLKQLTLALMALILSPFALAHGGHHEHASFLSEIGHWLSHWNHLSAGLGVLTLVVLVPAVVLLVHGLKALRVRKAQQ